MLSLAVPAVLLVVVVMVAPVDAGCQFPGNLQTNRSSGGARRDWVGRVRQQFSDVGVEVVVAGNVIRVASTGASSASYTLVCLQLVASERYLVAYEQTGQRRARYTCVQFVRRSSDVLQVRSAAVGERMDRAVCRDAALVTDRWLFFDRSTLGRHRVACPLHGGYSVHLFDKVDTHS